MSDPSLRRRAAMRSTAAVEAGRARFERERARRSSLAALVEVLERQRLAGGGVFAGALAFRLFLVVLPLTLVLVAGLGYLDTIDAGRPADVARQFGIKGVLAGSINDSARLQDSSRWLVLGFGLSALAITSVTMVKTLRIIHALAWGMPVMRWRRSGRAAALCLLAVVVVFGLTGLAARARDAVGGVEGLALTLGLAVVFTGVWLVGSLWLPHPSLPWTRLLPGALLVGGGVEVLHLVTVYYVGPHLERSSELYGTLGVSFAVLGWLYLAGWLMVGAPLLNATLVDRHAAARRDETLVGDDVRVGP